jgi:hypothetical protein
MAYLRFNWILYLTFILRLLLSHELWIEQQISSFYFHWVALIYTSSGHLSYHLRIDHIPILFYGCFDYWFCKSFIVLDDWFIFFPNQIDEKCWLHIRTSSHILFLYILNSFCINFMKFFFLWWSIIFQIELFDAHNLNKKITKWIKGKKTECLFKNNNASLIAQVTL